MNPPLALLEEKSILFKRYREITLQQADFMQKGDIAKVQGIAQEKELLTASIKQIDVKLTNEEIDQSSLAPLIKEVLELEERMTAEIARQKSGLNKESGDLRKGHHAIKQYLQK